MLTGVVLNIQKISPILTQTNLEMLYTFTSELTVSERGKININLVVKVLQIKE